jgi:hypothetical protein
LEGANKGEVYIIDEVRNFKTDYYINLIIKSDTIKSTSWYHRRISYLKTKKYWTTKSELRDIKLKKIIKKSR